VRLILFALCAATSIALTAVQDPPARVVDELTRPFDRVLDVYVRDGYVYYAALKQERSALDAYLRAIANVSPAELNSWPKSRQLAFWINAYNAFVLETVIDHYPIRGGSAAYPPDSIRQVPGAFERRTFRAGGHSLTLDAIELDVIAQFRDARALLALGRGAVGSGRLKSEAYVSDRVDEQLADMEAEIVTRREMVQIDLANNAVSISPLFSWRAREFIAFYTDRADTRYIERSPVERAVLGLLVPIVLPLESDFLMKNQFSVVFHDYDWRLNDLATR
jgi:Protein of unknown function, DUF547